MLATEGFIGCLLPAGRSAPDIHVRAALRPLVSPDYVEHVTSDVWALSHPARFNRHAEHELQFFEGFVTTAFDTPRRCVSDIRVGRWQTIPDGHFSSVMAPGDGTLCLLRGLSGGERMYFARIDGSWWFAASIKLLLGHPRFTRQIDTESMPELLASGLNLFGARTPLAGIYEVMAGHYVDLDRSNLQLDVQATQKWLWRDLLTPPQGSAEELAGEFRARLTDAVYASAKSGPVAVSLSGGIDSAAIARCAVDAFGADRVTAYTYVFNDPSHASEFELAQQVCKQLGIRDHRRIHLGFADFIEAIPEAVWRAEGLPYWPKAFFLCAARAIVRDGFDRVLSGFGIGSHMATFDAVGRAWQHVSGRAALKTFWRLAPRLPRSMATRLEWLHPALALPNQRVTTLFNALQHVEQQPIDAGPVHVGSVQSELSVTGGFDLECQGLSTVDALKQQAFAHLVSCIDVTRWEKPLREVGLLRLSPAHYASVLPYAYLPYNPGPHIWQRERLLRPGKHLLRIGFAGDIPDTVRTRRKLWSDAVISPNWMRAGLHWMREALAPHAENPLYAGQLSARELNRLDMRSPQATVTALAFLKTVVLDRASMNYPPTWNELFDNAKSHRPVGVAHQAA